MTNKKFSESDLIKILNVERKFHPLASLVDYYKLVFQAVFGPSHIFSNKKMAKNSFFNEIALLKNSDNAKIQDLSFINDFIRVDLHLLKKYNIDVKIFWEILVKSALVSSQIDKKEWKHIWKTAENYLSNFYLKNFDSDKKTIDDNIDNNFAFHHSKIYRNTYNPHYRVVSRKLWQDLLKKD